MPSKTITVDLTVTISIILAACAIIAPVLTTILSNIHDTKIKKIELAAKHAKETFFYKRGVYEEYLKITGNLLHDKSNKAYAEYGKIYPLALIYFPNSLTVQLTDINKLIIKGSKSEALPKFEALTNAIRTILEGA